MKSKINKEVISVIGLGYVGLPLAIEFSRKYSVIGYDLNSQRIDELRGGYDSTKEIEEKNLLKKNGLHFTDNIDDIKNSSIYIITVPTPIDEKNKPDLTPLKNASKLVGQNLDADNLVVFESTVYPGATEEVCVPILEECSGLKFNYDFYVGYSPERINPGDKMHKVTDILKVTSGSTETAAEKVDKLYASIIKAGTFKAASIRVAEAAKVIENTQRDVNIALINELSIIFNKLDIDTEDVLRAAGTKWNFQTFWPGLVGGHCIGVDPYYLTYKAQSIGYQPEIILAGRRLNDAMAFHVADTMMKAMLDKGIKLAESKVIILGVTFKENCPDIRNTKVFDVIREFKKNNIDIEFYDPWVDSQTLDDELKQLHTNELKENFYDGILLSVAHNEFKELGLTKIKNLGKGNSILYDLKYILSQDEVDLRL